jgi:hypothetical protein
VFDLAEEAFNAVALPIEGGIEGGKAVLSHKRGVSELGIETEG